MPKRPTVTLETDLFSLKSLLFKYSEDLSEWKNKSGIYCYCKLGYKGDKPYLTIIYIGTTLSFKNIKFYTSQLIRSYQPTHICFYEGDGKMDLQEIAAELIAHYKPLALTEEAV